MNAPARPPEPPTRPLPSLRARFVDWLRQVGLAGLPRPGAGSAKPGATAERLAIDLLTLAADAVLTLAPDGSLQGLVEHGSLNRLQGLDAGQGELLWRIPGLRLDPDMLLMLQQALQQGHEWRDLKLSWVTPEQRRWFFSCAGLPRRGANGELLGFAMVLRDLSAEARFHDLFRRLPHPLLLHRAGHILDANPAAVALFGCNDLQSLLADELYDHFRAGSAREQVHQHFAAAMRAGPGASAAGVDLEFVLASGETRLVQMTSVRTDDHDGAAILSMLSDETQRRQAEQAVLRSEALLSHLVATSPDVITLTEIATGRYAMVNPTFVRMTGFSAEQVIGKTSAELGIWSNAADRSRMVQAIKQDGMVQNMSTTFIGRNGRPLPMLLSAARFAMDGRDYLVINARDVSETEQLRLEYEAIVDNASIGIALTRDQHFLMSNPKFDSMLGWPPGLLVGQHGSVVWPNADVHAEIGRLVGARLSAGEQIEIERVMKRRDGSEFLCRLLAKAVNPTHPSRGGTIWLAEDVTERRQVDQALARARDDAEAASTAKSAFLANTSHEIRTPLNALLGLSHLARQPEVDELRRRDYIEQISDSAETLSAIITDILDLSKIEAGKLHLDNQPFLLADLLQSLKQAYGALADAKGLAFHLDADDDLPAVVQGDPVRLRQILSNYLNNALKFTDQGEIILKVLRGRGQRLRFELFDTGPGIDPAGLEQLFRPFSQVDSSINRRFGGTGLGLSICRQLAELMGGEVGVSSQPGQGSCFWAEMPLPEGNRDELEPTTGHNGLDPIDGARVLMVEDNPVNMMIAVALLEQWGADVVQAVDGHEAVAAVDRSMTEGRPFDIVLMDVQMPGLSGHDATVALRKLHSASELPIIALTAAALVSERDKALAAGMNDFLTKPIDAQRLRRTLVRSLRQANPAADESSG